MSADCYFSIITYLLGTDAIKVLDRAAQKCMLNEEGTNKKRIMFT